MLKFFRNDEGATAIEYGIIAAAMAIALVAAMPSITNALVGEFSSIGGMITGF